MINAGWAVLWDLNNVWLARVPYELYENGYVLNVPEDRIRCMQEYVFFEPELDQEGEGAFLMHLSQERKQERSTWAIKAERVVLAPAEEPGRRDHRVDTKLPIEVCFPGRYPRQKFPGVLKNISAGGVLFSCTETFEIGMQCSFKLPFVKVPLAMEIVNTIPTDRPDTVGYCCKLLTVSNMIDESIRGYVFQQELEKRKRMPHKTY